jgi:hypothetical protein
MLFGMSFHPSNVHPIDIHPVEAAHPSGAKPSSKAGDKPTSLAVMPGHDPFSSSSSGLPAGGKPMKSTLQKVTWPNKQGDYVVKTNDAPDANGSRPVYKRDDETGAPMPTHERAKDDGHGNWKIVGETDTAQPAKGPSLPPAAKIDSRQLEALKGDGTYPGGDGNSYARGVDGHHPVIYDEQLQEWRAVDPSKPNDFSRSVPVKLDGEGGAKPLPRVGIKGGMDPADARGSVEEGLRVRETKATWATAVAKHSRLALQADSAIHDFHRAGESLRNAEEKQAAWQRSRDQESDPARRKGLQAEVHRATNNKSNAKKRYEEAHNRMRSLESQAEVASRDQRSAFDNYHSALEDGYKAMAVPQSSKRLP